MMANKNYSKLTPLANAIDETVKAQQSNVIDAGFARMLSHTAWGSCCLSLRPQGWGQVHAGRCPDLYSRVFGSLVVG